MGSSTASETTINTSTDSSNTIVTTVTATDGEITEDSLDMQEPPVDFLINTDNFADSPKVSTILVIANFFVKILLIVDSSTDTHFT